MTRLEEVRHGLDMGQLINEVVITIVKEDPGPSINAVENVIVFPWLFQYVFLLESSSIPISEKRTRSRLEKKTEFSQYCLLSWFDLWRCLASGLYSSPKRLRSCRSAGSVPEQRLGIEAILVLIRFVGVVAFLTRLKAFLDYAVGNCFHLYYRTEPKELPKQTPFAKGMLAQGAVTKEDVVEY